MTRLAVLLAGALAIGAGGSARELPSPAHVVVIVFENKDASQINARSARRRSLRSAGATRG